MDDDGPSTIAVVVEATAWYDLLDDPVTACRRAVGATLTEAAGDGWPASAEVGVLLADDATVRQLNAEWRGLDRPTNVLSFPALDLTPDGIPPAPPAGPACLGDIALALETVRREAAEQDKSVLAHLSHLLVHGTLHLFGHDHQGDAEAERMERLEREILAGLGIGDPYADPETGHDEEALEATS